MERPTELREVLQNRILSKIESNQDKIKSALTRIETDGSKLKDFIACVGKECKLHFTANGRMYMNLEEEQYNLHSHALRQSAEKLNVPAKFIKDLQGTDWGRQLSARILNDHTDHTERTRLLVRTIDGEVRGVLSDSYRRLNTAQIFGNFIKAVGEQDAEIVDALTDDTRSYIETIRPELIRVEIPGQVIHLVYGVRISSSDYGDGALEVRSFIMQAVCLNGLVTEKAIKKIHLGGRLPDELEISNKTYQLDSDTQSSLTYDMVKQLYAPSTLEAKIEAIEKAASTECDLDRELINIAKKGIIAKAEGEEIRTILMNNNPEDGVDGGNSLWKLSQGISAIARTKDDRRSRELQEVAGSYIK